MLICKYLVDQQTNQQKGTSRFQTMQQDFTNWKHNLLNTTELNVFWSDGRLSSLTLTFTLIFLSETRKSRIAVKQTKSDKQLQDLKWRLVQPLPRSLFRSRKDPLCAPAHEDYAATRSGYLEQALWAGVCALKGFCFLLLWW